MIKSKRPFLGILDLAKHMLYLAETHNIDCFKIYRTDFERAVFITSIYCIQHDINIRHDILFEKTKYGASCPALSQEFSKAGYFGRNISYRIAKKSETLLKYNNLTEFVVNLLKKTQETPFLLVPYIINSPVYKMTYKKPKKNLYYYEYEQIWTLSEIYQFAGKKPSSIDDIRIPLSRKEYEAISKYLILAEDIFEKKGLTQPFTYEEIKVIREIPYSIIEACEYHGAYPVD